MYYDIFDTKAALALDKANQVAKSIPFSKSACDQRAVLDYGKYALLPLKVLSIRNICYPREGEELKSYPPPKKFE